MASKPETLDGLTAAVLETGLSAPTLNRRISEFEKSLSTQLFQREARGYILTTTGRELFEQLELMADQA